MSRNDNDYKVKHPDKHCTSGEGTRQTSGMCKMFMKTSCLWNGLSSMWNDEPGVFDRKSMKIVFVSQKFAMVSVVMRSLTEVVVLSRFPLFRFSVGKSFKTICTTQHVKLVKLLHYNPIQF